MAFLNRKNLPELTKQSVALTVRPRTLLTNLLLVCVIVVVGLFVGDWVINYAHAIDSPPIRRLFNITREDSLASWVATTITLLVALTMWALWVLSRASKASVVIRRGWLILAAAFTYLAIDDGAMIHERLGSVLSGAASIGWLASFPSYYWQIIFLPLLFGLAIYLLYFLSRQLTAPRQRLAVIVALACLGIAIILDFFEGLAPSNSLNIYTAVANQFDFASYTQRNFGQSEYDTLVHFSKSIEESLEMLAMSLLWATMLSHILSRYGRVSIKARIV